MSVPIEMTRNRPKNESERKAPTMGVKFDRAVHKNKILIPVVALKLYLSSKYVIMLASSPKLATFSNVSFAAKKSPKLLNVSKKKKKKTVRSLHNFACN